jgi:hypothetical protein
MSPTIPPTIAPAISPGDALPSLSEAPGAGEDVDEGEGTGVAAGVVLK